MSMDFAPSIAQMAQDISKLLFSMWKVAIFLLKMPFQSIIYCNKHTASKTAKSRIVMFMQSKKRVFFIQKCPYLLIQLL